ncbi:MAG: exodeoxyribonuclease VII small subunit [Kiritimatiellaeota bacterium]|nr:exodeoxyribonuclease VII small subunit [Kiritimatiellota bacterium]
MTPKTCNDETAPADARESIPFEQALERLETIVTEMEEGKLPIEAMMEKFEDGVKLASYCDRRLEEIRGRIEILVKKANGKDEWQEFEPGETP